MCLHSFFSYFFSTKTTTIFVTMDTGKKDNDTNLTIECGRNEDVSNLNFGDGKDGNRNLNKSMAYKLVFAIVASIIFAGCGNFVYLFAAGTREVKYVIPDGYILVPKQGKDHTSTTEAHLTKERESLSTTQEKVSVTQTTTTAEQMKTSAPGCEAGWLEFGSSCYFFSEDAMPWQNAFNTCKELGGYLAEVTSIEENDALVLKAKVLGGSRWIGMSDKDEEGTWVWASSKTVSTYFNWGPREPNNAPDNDDGEDCCELRKFSDYFWNDEGCFAFIKYICEKPFN